MFKTLKISFSLLNTYRVNTILFSLKQIPLIKKVLPATLYNIKGLKIFANILSVIWEIIATFLWKLVYILLMINSVLPLYKNIPVNQSFLHILLCLTVIGGLINTHIFSPTKDKYYAMILMRMDARSYTLVNYFYTLLKVIIGFIPFTIFFGLLWSVPLWFCLIVPFCIVGLKLFITSISLWRYEKKGVGYNENTASKSVWISIALLLGAAYGLPAVGVYLPEIFSISVFLLFIPLGIIGLRKVLTFKDYRSINKQLLSGLTNQMDNFKEARKKVIEKRISTDTTITSDRNGFEYLNELFIKRHKKILWNTTKKISYALILMFIGLQIILNFKPDIKPLVNGIVMTWLPYFVIILYAMNRGTSFTQALFINCDHSLLTYPLFKQPAFILKLFQIRLREIMKINAVPALIIGIGLALTLFNSGGTNQPLNYLMLIISILCMSLFFSIHYLTIYYLLQPYNAGTEIKSGTYRIIMVVTYLACAFIMNLRLPILVFGVMTIIFCVVYSIVASILIYRFAPKTFKIRV